MPVPLIAKALPFIGKNILPIAGSLFGIGSRKRAYKRSLQTMDHQFALDKKMWDYQNAYNTPKSQMQRLSDAGLNPALMYGQGTTGNSNSLPQSKFTQLEPFTQPSDIAQSTAAGTQLSLVNAQKKNIESQTTLNSITGAIKSGELELAKEMSKYQMANLTADTESKLEQKKLLVQQRLTEIQNETNMQRKNANEKLRGEILKIDKNFLKENMTSTYEYGLSEPT